MQFLNRINERKRLKDALEKEKAQLVIIYGRRRIGKSVLISSILQQNSIYFMADQNDASIQRVQLAAMIAEKIEGFDKIVYPNWDALFQNLANSVQTKITICIDEFPYLVKNSPELPSIIQRICDKKTNKNFHMVLCGSSQQMMRSLVLNYASPLYGRATEIMRIKGMNVFWLMEAIDCSPEQAICEYSIWGGIPRYWEIRSAEKDLDEAILNTILDKSGILHEEPVRLFMDEMRESVMAFSILNVVGNGANRLSEIAGRLNKPASSLSGILQVLIELGFLRREIPFGTSLKSTKKTLYKISDQFMLFYFRVVNPNLSRLELGLKEQVYEASKQLINNHIAECWEELCRQSIPFLNFGGIQFDMASRWWGNTIDNEIKEFDIIAESLDKKHLLVAECKWSDSVDIENQLINLAAKALRLPFIDNYQPIYLIFAKSVRNDKVKNYISPNEVVLALKDMP
jgi:uncharacterized protein